MISAFDPNVMHTARERADKASKLRQSCHRTDEIVSNNSKLLDSLILLHDNDRGPHRGSYEGDDVDSRLGGVLEGVGEVIEAHMGLFLKTDNSMRLWSKYPAGEVTDF